MKSWLDSVVHNVHLELEIRKQMTACLHLKIQLRVKVIKKNAMYVISIFTTEVSRFEGRIGGKNTSMVVDVLLERNQLAKSLWLATVT